MSKKTSNFQPIRHNIEIQEKSDFRAGKEKKNEGTNG